MEIAKMLTISTGHITKETANLLEKDSIREIVVYSKGGYGYFVHVPDEFDYLISKNEIPEDLCKCIELALKNKIDWICLDRDGEIISELREYEW